MIHCHSCGTNNLDSSSFCDECGTRIAQAAVPIEPVAAYVPPSPVITDNAPVRPVTPSASVTSIGVPPVNGDAPVAQVQDVSSSASSSDTMKAKLVVERGELPGVEFRLSGTEATIGRWDADNGIFPDVDLDAHDQEAKVSRRHARIKFLNGQYYVEDLGSTNGTYVNRGRRLLPGNAQLINDGDEVIVGKTFMRFRVTE